MKNPKFKLGQNVNFGKEGGVIEAISVAQVYGEWHYKVIKTMDNYLKRPKDHWIAESKIVLLVN